MLTLLFFGQTVFNICFNRSTCKTHDLFLSDVIHEAYSICPEAHLNQSGALCCPRMYCPRIYRRTVTIT